MFYSLLTIFILFASVKVFAENNVIDRYALREDKFYTHQMIAGENFIFETSVYGSKELKKFIRRGKRVGEQENAEEELKFIQNLLEDYHQTEQGVRASTGIKIPLPGFSIGRFKSRVKLEVGVQAAFLMDVLKRKFDFKEVLNYVGNDVPDFIRRKLVNCSSPDLGEDVIQNAVDNNCIGSFFATPYIGKYFYPSSEDVPQIFAYAKSEGRVGPVFYYTYGKRKRWRGKVKLYWRGRSDLNVRISDMTVKSDNTVMDIPSTVNYANVALDYALRYQRKRWRWGISIEEVDLYTTKENKELSEPLAYKGRPLFRWHNEYRFASFFGLRSRAYFGAHWRRPYYSLGEGYYIGGEISTTSSWAGLKLRGLLDKEFLSFSTSLNLWWLNLAGWIKHPRQKMIEGIKISPTVGVTLSIII